MRRTAGSRRGLATVGALICAAALPATFADARPASTAGVFTATLTVRAVWSSTLERTDVVDARCKSTLRADAMRTITVRTVAPVRVVFRNGRLVGTPVLPVSGSDTTAGSNTRDEICGVDVSSVHADCARLTRRFTGATVRLTSQRQLDVTPVRLSHRSFDPEGDCFVEPAVAKRHQPGVGRIHAKLPAKRFADPRTVRIVVRGTLGATANEGDSKVEERITWTLTLRRSRD